MDWIRVGTFTLSTNSSMYPIPVSKGVYFIRALSNYPIFLVLLSIIAMYIGATNKVRHQGDWG